MSGATLVNDSMAVSCPESRLPTIDESSIDVECVKCDVCGLTEDCTPAYVVRIRERYQGRWICGLCAEAVKDEIFRSSERLISMEEALDRHMNFCKTFSCSSPPRNSTEMMISAMKQLLRKSLDSPRSPTSTPSSPHRKGGESRPPRQLTRSESCIPNL